MKYFYYDKKLINEGKLYCKGIENKKLTAEELKKQGKNELYKDVIIYEGETNFIGYPILENNTIRPATRLELVNLGKQELKVGEYIEDNEIKKKPFPSDMFIPKWNKETFEWEESAREIDFVRRDYYSYLELNNSRRFKQMEESGVLSDWMEFIDSCEMYIYNSEKRGVSTLGRPEPSESLKVFKDNINLPNGVYTNSLEEVKYTQKTSSEQVWNRVENVWK